jgi:phage shock protein A
VANLNDRLGNARDRLQLLQARMRQTEARRAMGKVMKSVDRTNLYGEFERLGERVERGAAEEAAYLKLDAEITGADVKRRFESEAMDEAAEERLARLRAELDEASDEGQKVA